jgi:hypothetical protein
VGHWAKDGLNGCGAVGGTEIGPNDVLEGVMEGTCQKSVKKGIKHTIGVRRAMASDGWAKDGLGGIVMSRRTSGRWRR